MELKGLGLNSGAAFRKPLLSEANWNKGFNFAQKHDNCTLEQRKNFMWSDESRLTPFQSDQGEKGRGCRSVPETYCTCLWRQSNGLKLLQLVSEILPLWSRPEFDSCYLCCRAGKARGGRRQHSGQQRRHCDGEEVHGRSRLPGREDHGGEHNGSLLGELVNHEECFH